MLDWLRKRIREAGTFGEENTERDGFLSHAAETHSVAYGLGFGAAIALKLLGIPFVLELVLLALGGVTVKRRFGNERVWREITDEVQYFLPSILLGFLAVMVPAVLAGATVAL